MFSAKYSRRRICIISRVFFVIAAASVASVTKQEFVIKTWGRRLSSPKVLQPITPSESRQLKTWNTVSRHAGDRSVVAWAGQVACLVLLQMIMTLKWQTDHGVSLSSVFLSPTSPCLNIVFMNFIYVPIEHTSWPVPFVTLFTIIPHTFVNRFHVRP